METSPMDELIKNAAKLEMYCDSMTQLHETSGYDWRWVGDSHYCLMSFEFFRRSHGNSAHIEPSAGVEFSCGQFNLIISSIQGDYLVVSRLGENGSQP